MAAALHIPFQTASHTPVGVLPPARRLKPRAPRCEAGLRRRIQAAAAAFAWQAAGFSPTACAASRSHTLRNPTVVLSGSSAESLLKRSERSGPTKTFTHS
jgi:hypothetical protein